MAGSVRIPAPAFAAAVLAGLGAAGAPAAAEAPPMPTNLCVGCHSPIDGPPLSGVLTGRWLAPNITPDPVSGIGAWSRDDLFRYLRDGNAPGRGQAAGPMAPVVEALRPRSDAEIDALIDWMLEQPAHRDPADEAPASERGERLVLDSAELEGTALGVGDPDYPGVALYNGSCAACHGVDGAGSPGGDFPSMFDNSAVGRSPPHNLVAVLLDGVKRHRADGTAFMQSFDATRGLPGALSDDELSELSNFLLGQFGGADAASITPEQVERSRLEWWGEGTPTAARGELIAVGGGPGGVGATCFACHGLKGEGDAGSGAPRLAGLDVSYFAKQMRDYASGLRPHGAMTPIAQELSEVDHHALALYYADLPAEVAIPAVRPDGPLLEAGEALYSGGAPKRGVQPCADCHGPAARGFEPVFPALVQPAIYTAGQLRLWREGVRHNDPHALMAAAVTPLTDADIDAVAAYLGGLEP